MCKLSQVRPAIFLGLLLAGALPAGVPSAATELPRPAGAARAAQPFVLEDGTAVKLRALRTISSANAHPGDSVDFEVIYDVLLDGFCVIPRGSVAQATVTAVHRKRRMGRGGKLGLRLDSIRLRTGQTVILRSEKEVRGAGHKTVMATGMAVTALAFYPAAPALLFVRGQESVLLQGTEVTAYVYGNFPLDAAGFDRPLTAEAAQTAEPPTMAPAEMLPVSASPAAAPANQVTLEQLLTLLPRRVLDGHGHEGDMVNLLFIGTQDQLEAAFEQAGWMETIRSKPRAFWHAAHAPKNNVAMPMSRLFLFGRPQDYGYAMEDTVSTATRRHHLRIWKTDYEVAGYPVWAGAATHDVGIERDQHKWSITHKIDPEVDQERDFVGERLATAERLGDSDYLLPANPVLEATTATGGSYHSNGKILVIRLQDKETLLARAPKPGH
ncbi:MAG: LssY C-terminal domain-containing protein [Acidobacteriia bacterium]|nr:LssY C-terminal domain-containing protein [Terriglobia bacterium]